MPRADWRSAGLYRATFRLAGLERDRNASFLLAFRIQSFDNTLAESDPLW